MTIKSQFGTGYARGLLQIWAVYAEKPNIGRNHLVGIAAVKDGNNVVIHSGLPQK